jgi:hypothetical protein
VTTLGCPVANGKAPCPRCGGGWPGTKVTAAAMERMLRSGRLKPERLGCGVLKEQATTYLEANAVPGPLGGHN